MPKPPAAAPPGEEPSSPAGPTEVVPDGAPPADSPPAAPAPSGATTALAAEGGAGGGCGGGEGGGAAVASPSFAPTPGSEAGGAGEAPPERRRPGRPDPRYYVAGGFVLGPLKDGTMWPAILETEEGAARAASRGRPHAPLPHSLPRPARQPDGYLVIRYFDAPEGLSLDSWPLPGQKARERWAPPAARPVARPLSPSPARPFRSLVAPRPRGPRCLS